MNDSFIMRRSYIEAISYLPKDIQLEMMKCVLEYGLNGRKVEHPTFNCDSVDMCQLMLILIYGQIDADSADEYEDIREDDN